MANGSDPGLPQPISGVQRVPTSGGSLPTPGPAPAPRRSRALATRLLIGTPLLLVVLGVVGFDAYLEGAGAPDAGDGPPMPVAWGFGALSLVVAVAVAAEFVNLFARRGWKLPFALTLGMTAALVMVGFVVGSWSADRIVGPSEPAEFDSSEFYADELPDDASEAVAEAAPRSSAEGEAAATEITKSADLARRSHLMQLLFVGATVVPVFGIVLLLIWIVALWSGPPGDAGHEGRVQTALGLLFVVGLVGTAYACGLLLRHLPYVGFPLVLLGLLASRLGDAGAYFAGRFLGRHGWAQRVSPKKTVEGFIGGLVVSGLIAWGIGSAFPVLWAMFGGWPLILIGVILGFSAQIADLLASAFKRWAGAKDSSQLIPQFGGVIDLTDGFLLSLPILYAIVCAWHLVGFVS